VMWRRVVRLALCACLFCACVVLPGHGRGRVLVSPGASVHAHSDGAHGGTGSSAPFQKKRLPRAAGGLVDAVMSWAGGVML